MKDRLVTFDSLDCLQREFAFLFLGRRVPELRRSAVAAAVQTTRRNLSPEHNVAAVRRLTNNTHDDRLGSNFAINRHCWGSPTHVDDSQDAQGH